MRWMQALGQNEHTQYCFLPPPLPITARQPHPGLPITGVPPAPGCQCCHEESAVPASWARAPQDGFLMVAVNFPCSSTVPWVSSQLSGDVAAWKKGMQRPVPAGA